MKKQYRVNVTAKDIRNGTLRNIFSCPIARAAKRVTGKRCYAFSDGEILIDFAYFSMPMKAQKFIDDFDSLRHPKPLSFVIRRVRKEGFNEN